MESMKKFNTINSLNSPQKSKNKSECNLSKNSIPIRNYNGKKDRKKERLASSKEIYAAEIKKIEIKNMQSLNYQCIEDNLPKRLKINIYTSNSKKQTINDDDDDDSRCKSSRIEKTNQICCNTEFINISNEKSKIDVKNINRKGIDHYLPNYDNQDDLNSSTSNSFKVYISQKIYSNLKEYMKNIFEKIRSLSKFFYFNTNFDLCKSSIIYPEFNLQLNNASFLAQLGKSKLNSNKLQIKDYLGYLDHFVNLTINLQENQSFAKNNFDNKYYSQKDWNKIGTILLNCIQIFLNLYVNCRNQDSNKLRKKCKWTEGELRKIYGINKIKKLYTNKSMNKE